MKKFSKIILASASPRRKSILQMLGLSFRIVPSKIEERMNPRLKPKGIAEDLAKRKAIKIAEKYPDALIIGADTVVVCNEKILGKPESIDEAKRMLKLLSGTVHSVITGIAVVHSRKKIQSTKSVETKIYFRKIALREIDAYVKVEDVLDKAGGYMIQGKASLFIEKIEGDYFNAVGLPVYTLAQELKKLGVYLI